MLDIILIVTLVPLAGLVAWFGLRADRQAAEREALREVAPADPVATSDDQLSAFLIGMSHELRTPLNAVIGFSEMLAEAKLPPLQQRQVRMISDSCGAMLRLVNDILDLSRIRSGQMRLVEEEVDLVAEMEQVAALMHPIAANRGIALDVAIAPGFPNQQMVDRVRLRQVLLVLVGNALKATEQGRVAIDASARDGHLHLVVRDSGPGIATERLAILFTPFAPAPDGSAPAADGTGLGLPICAELVRLMGGKIAVESRLGQGSAFAVVLPLRPIASGRSTAATAAARPAMVVSAVSAPTPAGFRVLIAEDHEVNQQLVLAMAEALGLDAELAVDGREAVEMADRARACGRPFQLVLMDVQMPGMDGLAAARALRAGGHSGAELPIIALTANCFPQDIAAVLEAGMQAHLAKPLVLADLSRAIAEVAPAALAVPTGPGSSCDVTRLPQGVSPIIHALDHRYRQRKREIVGGIAQVIGTGDTAGPTGDTTSAETIDWEAIAHGLHKLAGVAANFGDARLGEISRQLEHALRGSGDARQRLQMLRERWPELHDAA
jgi:CheY-like chemotaxis protein/HPt (histidine-containing phosphotransfer) domain-containing protein